MSLNHFATRKSFGKFVSQSAINGFMVIQLTFATVYDKLGSFYLYADFMLRNSSV